MLHQPRQAATYHSRNPALSDSFYATVIKQVQAANAQRLQQQTAGHRYQSIHRSILLNESELWWQRIFIPEFRKAQTALQGKAILSESRSSARRDRADGYLARVINLRANHTSRDYLVAVENGQISFKKLQGAKVVAIDGFYTSVDLAKSSPGHVKLMLAYMIKDCLERVFIKKEGATKAPSTWGRTL